MYANFLLYSLLLLPTVLCGSLGSIDATPTYNLTDEISGESVKCEMCRPGEYLLKHCSKNRRTKCGPCGEQHYTEVWNFIQRCQYCNRFCTENEIESAPCNSTQNRECECKAGYYSLHGFCAKHKVCQAGHGVILNGTPHRNVKCEKCLEGFFSAKTSSTNACHRFSVCSPAFTTVPSNGKQDVFCSQCKSETDQHLCDKELIDFLVHHNLPPRTQKLFHLLLKRKAELAGKDAPSTLQLLRSIKEKMDIEGSKSFGNEIHRILKNVKLFDVAAKVEKYFSLQLNHFPR